jgi:small subunit ribosomal protein S1
MTSDPNDTRNDTPNPAPEENTSPAPDSTPAPEDVPAPEVKDTSAADAPFEEPAEEPPASADPLAEEDNSEFAALLDASEQAGPAKGKPGDKVTGKIVQIDGKDAFVDCGLRNELPIDLAEIQVGPDGPAPQIGDEVTAYIQKSDDGLKLAKAVNLKDAGREALTAAYAAGTPIRGKVLSTNKGGFSVDLDGTRAFCPFSQIDVRRADDPDVFIGKTYQFKLLELSEDGRNIVVSRRALVQAEREAEATTTRENLSLGDALEGTVTRLVPFGAFVDVGGIEGLVHISQISHQRVGDPSDVLQEGQPVKVKVLEIQNLGMGRSERISLSIKALATDPWPDTAASMVPGTDVTGRITRLVDFGVFVELLPGVEGLIHISELANRRIMHPREILNEDEEISIRILDVDVSRRRISLSRRQATDYDGD